MRGQTDCPSSTTTSPVTWPLTSRVLLFAGPLLLLALIAVCQYLFSALLVMSWPFFTFWCYLMHSVQFVEEKTRNITFGIIFSSPPTPSLPLSPLVLPLHAPDRPPPSQCCPFVISFHRVSFHRVTISMAISYDKFPMSRQYHHHELSKLQRKEQPNCWWVIT